MRLLALFCSVDEFWQRFAPWWQRQLLASGARQRLRPPHLHPSEIMTSAILFQQSHPRTSKAFYTEHVQRHLRGKFPQVVSSSRCVKLLPTVLVPLIVYLPTQRGTCTSTSIIDATALAVCANARIRQHRVFARDAARGKTSASWFYGFRLPRVVNDRGALLAFCLTPGNVDDRRPVPHLVKRRFGKLLGDQGDISQDLATAMLVPQGVHLITNPRKRKNMHNRLLAVADKLLLRKRASIETIAARSTFWSTAWRGSSPLASSPKHRRWISACRLFRQPS